MLSDFVNELSERLHELFPHAKHIVVAIDDSVVVSGAVDASHLIIPEEINAVLKEVASKYNLRTGELVWEREGNNLIVHLVPDLTGATVIEAHWSTDDRDSHTVNDADSTYAVKAVNGELVRIFNNKEEAEQYIHKHSNR